MDLEHSVHDLRRKMKHSIVWLMTQHFKNNMLIKYTNGILPLKKTAEYFLRYIPSSAKYTFK